MGIPADVVPAVIESAENDDLAFQRPERLHCRAQLERIALADRSPGLQVDAHRDVDPGEPERRLLLRRGHRLEPGEGDRGALRPEEPCVARSS
jgi:hypothetical protein